MAAQTAPEVTVKEATAAERPGLQHLLQLYLHDFSEHAMVGSAVGDVDDNGLFSYRSGIDRYWQEAGCVPLLIRAEGSIAGFALLNRWSALDQPVDHAVAEFFVLRKYRWAGVGTLTAHRVFRGFPGRWEVAVADYNRAALLFWRAALCSPELSPVTEHAGNGERWSGTVLCFVVGTTG